MPSPPAGTHPHHLRTGGPVPIIGAAPEHRRGHREQSGHRDQGPPMSVRRPTLVVIDDDEDVRRALTRFLQLHGYDVLPFASAEAWLAAISPADGAVIDI